MKRIFYYGFIIFGFTIFASGAKADDTYIGVDLSMAKLELPRVSANLGMIRGRFGVVLFPDFSRKIGVESHMAFGLSDATGTRKAGPFADEEVKLELETILGVYLKAEVINVGILGVYGLVGFAAAQTGPALQARDANGVAQIEDPTDPNPTPLLNTDSSTGVSVGFGATVFINKSFSLQLEVLQVQTAKSELDFDVSSINLGVNIPL